MVLDPPRQQVSVKRMIIYMFIPFLNYYAFWRIQRFWLAMGVGMGWTWAFVLVSYGFDDTMDPSYSSIAYIILSAIAIVVNCLLMRLWATNYNKRIAASRTSETSSLSSS